MQTEYLGTLTTEMINPSTRKIDTYSTEDIVRCINEEDMVVASAVRAELPQIVRAIDLIYERLCRGGRLFYVGAGTSGRLGVLDASECPPTYGTDPEMVQGIIAGGDTALRTAVEGAEDDLQAGVDVIARHSITEKDAVVGITASGYAPFVIGALEAAQAVGAGTIALINNQTTALENITDVCIAPVVGPEVIAGSTRMKAGTATKMVLNILTTTVMIKMGKVYKNLMVDLCATNSKLLDRAIRIVANAADVDPDTAQQVLLKAGGDVKAAIVMQKSKVSAEKAMALLEKAHHNVRQALLLTQD